jgi:hypothetical protein
VNWLKRNIGLDWFDLAVQVVLTGLVMGIADESGADEGVLLAMTGVSILILAIRRALALRRMGPTAGLNSGEMAAVRFEELESRLSELEARDTRVAELEERLEFAERLLAKQADERVLQPVRNSAGEGGR